MWNALFVGPRKEQTARDYLVLHSHEVVCPVVKEVRRVPLRGGRHRMVSDEVAAYPRYIFARPDGLMRLADEAPLWVGRMTVVKMGGEPVGIRDHVVAAFEAVAFYAGRIIRVGQEVPLTLLDGLVATIASVNRLASHGEVSVWLDMFGARRVVDVPFDQLGESA